jgi:glycosyltransferase involved in cell wall biosynthesis
MISIIVPVYNAGRHLERVIEAIQKQDYSPSEHELILVDNGSDDNSLEILKRHPEIRSFSEPERGSYAARNLAIRKATGKILVFTDSDCYPVPGWLKAIDKAFLDTRTKLLLGPRFPATDRNRVHLVSEYENRKAEMVCASDDPQVYFGYTNNMAVRSSVMDQFGPFIHQARGSDTIFVRRVVDALSCEAVAYCSGMAVQHVELKSIGVYYKKVMIYARSAKSYRQIISARSLSQKERLRVYRQTIRRMPVTDSVLLFMLLLGGAVAWLVGSLAVSAPDS